LGDEGVEGGREALGGDCGGEGIDRGGCGREAGEIKVEAAGEGGGIGGGGGLEAGGGEFGGKEGIDRIWRKLRVES
jgi:hypothetical protein